jgi:hypothetical protein
LFFRLPLEAQISTTQTPAASLQFNTTGFPLWVKDLRRAEIVAFGSFPFTMFVSTFAMDTWRFFEYGHGQDNRYAPWPFKSAGAVDMSVDEHKKVLFAALMGSLAVSLADQIILQIKRASARKRALELPEGSPIVVRRPLSRNKGAETGETPPPEEKPEDAEVPPGETGIP